jgi:anti-sigma B factor antagonist
MRITERRLGSAAVLDLAGPVAGFKADAALGAAVRRQLEAGSRLVVANLGSVPSIDITGLGALVQAYRAARNAGADMRLAGVTRRIHDLVVLTRLLTVFDSYDSVEAALGAPAGTGAGEAAAVMPLGGIERFLHRA